MYCSVWGICGSEDLDEDVVPEASVVLRDDNEEGGFVLDPATLVLGGEDLGEEGVLETVLVLGMRTPANGVRKASDPSRYCNAEKARYCNAEEVLQRGWCPGSPRPPRPRGTAT